MKVHIIILWRKICNLGIIIQLRCQYQYLSENLYNRSKKSKNILIKNILSTAHIAAS